MWPRCVEILLGAWLAVSPFVLRGPEAQAAQRASDILCGVLIIAFAVATFFERFRRAHLLSLAVGFWLVGYGWGMASHPAAPALQNNILVGLTLLLVAIIPTEAGKPPPAWRLYFSGPRDW